MNPPEYEAPDGCWYDSPEEYLWVGIMGGCGCGSSDEIAELAHEILGHFGKPFDERKLKIYDKIEYEIIAHWLDSKELIEHGSSVGGSWLTDKGKELLEVLKSAPTHKSKDVEE
jgi:hypothetical protein